MTVLDWAIPSSFYTTTLSLSQLLSASNISEHYDVIFMESWKTLTSRHVTGRNATLTSMQSSCHRYRHYTRWKICFLPCSSIIMSMSCQHIHTWNFRIICLLFSKWPLKSTVLVIPAKTFRKIAVYRDSGNCIYANQRWQFTKKTWTYQRHPSNKTEG